MSTSVLSGETSLQKLLAGEQCVSEVTTVDGLQWQMKCFLQNRCICCALECEVPPKRVNRCRDVRTNFTVYTSREHYALNHFGVDLHSYFERSKHDGVIRLFAESFHFSTLQRILRDLGVEDKEFSIHCVFQHGKFSEPHDFDFRKHQWQKYGGPASLINEEGEVDDVNKFLYKGRWIEVKIWRNLSDDEDDGSNDEPNDNGRKHYQLQCNLDDMESAIESDDVLQGPAVDVGGVLWTLKCAAKRSTTADLAPQMSHSNAVAQATEILQSAIEQYRAQNKSTESFDCFLASEIPAERTAVPLGVHVWTRICVDDDSAFYYYDYGDPEPLKFFRSSAKQCSIWSQPDILDRAYWNAIAECEVELVDLPGSFEQVVGADVEDELAFYKAKTREEPKLDAESLSVAPLTYYNVIIQKMDEIESLKEKLNELKEENAKVRAELADAEKTIENLTAKIRVYELESSSLHRDTFTSRFLTDFDDIETIGSGGFGVVLECRNKIDNNKYAVKRIAVKINDEELSRVFREAQAMARLHHPNIVRYFSVWTESPPLAWQMEKDKELKISSGSVTSWMEDDDEASFSLEMSGAVNSFEGEQFMVVKKKEPKQQEQWAFVYVQMELCRRTTLGKWLSRRNEENRAEDCEPRKMRVWLTQIVSAVHFIHKRGFIHRDLKPPNILLSLDGASLKIADLGLARTFREGEKMSNQGTVAYMSFELLYQSHYDQKVDIYAIGLIFAEMLCIYPNDTERWEMLAQLREGHVPSQIEAMPKEASFISWLTMREPKDRPSSEELLKCAYLNNEL